MRSIVKVKRALGLNLQNWKTGRFCWLYTIQFCALQFPSQSSKFTAYSLSTEKLPWGRIRNGSWMPVPTKVFPALENHDSKYVMCWRVQCVRKFSFCFSNTNGLEKSWTKLQPFFEPAWQGEFAPHQGQHHSPAKRFFWWWGCWKQSIILSSD